MGNHPIYEQPVTIIQKWKAHSGLEGVAHFLSEDKSKGIQIRAGKFHEKPLGSQSHSQPAIDFNNHPNYRHAEQANWQLNGVDQQKKQQTFAQTKQIGASKRAEYEKNSRNAITAFQTTNHQ